MIDQNQPNNQLPNELRSVFSELEMTETSPESGHHQNLRLFLFVLVPAGLLF